MQWLTKEVMLKREPSIFNVAGLGTKRLTKEYVEALCRMVDMENAGDRDSVKYVGTITCDEEEALVLAEAESSLMGVSTAAMVFGLAMGVQIIGQPTTTTIANNMYSDR